MRIALLVVILVFLPVLGHAHPGRLDKDGCHTVRKDFVYKSGEVVRKGEYHCHRLNAKLGSLVLSEPNDDQRDDEEMTEEKQSP